MKNIFLLGLLVFVTVTYAKEPIEKESMGSAESFKIEKAVKEKTAGRAFAGSKAKKDVDGAAPSEDSTMTEDSEVQYWRYQE